MACRNPIEPEQAAKLFEELAHTGRVAQSCKAVGVSKTRVQEQKGNDPDFAAKYQEALELYSEKLEQEAERRGHDGVDEPVYHKGEIQGTVKRFSDRLLELLMKKNNPQFRESVKVDAAISGGVLLVTSPEKDPEKWRQKHDGTAPE